MSCLVLANSYLINTEEEDLLQTVQKTGRDLPEFASPELMEQVLTQRELKARQSFKIIEIGEALITAGFVSLDAQAKALGLPRSTAWTILSATHKGTGLSARIICRILSSGELPASVRMKVLEYAQEKAAGIYGGSARQRCRFTAKLTLRGYGLRLHDVVKGRWLPLTRNSPRRDQRATDSLRPMLEQAGNTSCP